MSAPAEFGLTILQMLDNNAAAEKQVHEVKLAMGTGQPDILPELFPQWFGGNEVEMDSPEAEAALAAGTAVEDYSGVTWMSPSDIDETEMEEMMRLSEALFASSRVTVSQEPTGEWV